LAGHAITGENTSAHFFNSDVGMISNGDDFAGMVANIFMTSPAVTG